MQAMIGHDNWSTVGGGKMQDTGISFLQIVLQLLNLMLNMIVRAFVNNICQLHKRTDISRRNDYIPPAVYNTAEPFSCKAFRLNHVLHCILIAYPKQNFVDIIAKINRHCKKQHFIAHMGDIALSLKRIPNAGYLQRILYGKLRLGNSAVRFQNNKGIHSHNCRFPLQIILHYLIAVDIGPQSLDTVRHQLHCN